jgi:hypothetical protein
MTFFVGWQIVLGIRKIIVGFDERAVIQVIK